MLEPNRDLLPAAPLTWFADVQYRAIPRLIACAILETSNGLYLVDPGPTVSLGTLEATLAASGTGFHDVRGLLLTHIHLDHAGAAGTIVHAHPHVTVFVHERGARHLVRPGRLLASATRIYGDRMNALWGAFLATPDANVHVLQGGEHLRLGDRSLRVAYTPGHASHHVCYLDELTGTAFLGDTAGMRVVGTQYIVPVAPPPDIDVEAWRTSLALLRSWDSERLFLTHFGPSTDVAWHLDHAEERLGAWAAAVRASLGSAGDDAARAARFHRREMKHAFEALSEQDRLPYQHMGQPRASWYGLARYWRKVRSVQAQ